MVEEENCADCDYSDRSVEAYLQAISEALLAEQAGLGWRWIQPTPPQAQTVLSVSVGGKSVAALIDRTRWGSAGNQHTNVSIAFEGCDGCCAHHVVFDRDADRYHAVSIDYGWAANSIVDVAWTYDPTSGAVSLEGYFGRGSVCGAAPITGVVAAWDRVRRDESVKAEEVPL